MSDLLLTEQQEDDVVECKKIIPSQFFQNFTILAILNKQPRVEKKNVSGITNTLENQTLYRQMLDLKGYALYFIWLKNIEP